MIELFVEGFPLFMEGLQVTLILTLISIVLGTIFGIILVLGKMYGNKMISIITNGFIQIIRGTPLLVQLFLFYYALPRYGIKLSAFTAAIISFTINSAAYQAEYLRGSIQSISSGQMRAAYAIGMSKWQGVVHVILPQALRRVIPSWTNEFIYLLKYTSLAYLIGTEELMAQAKFFAGRNFQYFKVYMIVAFIYLLVVVFFSRVFNWIENKVRIPGFEYNR
ncbi:MAG: amino acid ABC transporter permease [Halanaerobiaceae bacterium]